MPNLGRRKNLYQMHLNGSLAPGLDYRRSPGHDEISIPRAAILSAAASIRSPAFGAVLRSLGNGPIRVLRVVIGKRSWTNTGL